MISWAVKTTSTDARNPSMSNEESSWRKVMRLKLARLQAELSRCMYSEHGLDPLIRPVLDAVCHLLMVVSNCMPGSAHSQAAWANCRKRSRAATHRIGPPSPRLVNAQSPPATTASMNSSVTRTELLAFWYCRLMASLPSRSMSNPASRNTRALRSSMALHQMKSSMSGCSASRMTILAARLVFPPDLMVPAEESAPRMKLTGPEAVPPPLSSSWDQGTRDRLAAAPDSPLKMTPSSVYQFRMESMVSSTE